MQLRLRLGAVALPDVGREVWLLCIATGLLNAGYLSMMGLLKVIFVLRLGYGADFVGTLFAIGSLSFALSSLLGGVLGARFGPRPVMIAGALIVVIGMAFLPFTEFVPAPVQPLWPAMVQIVSSCGWAWFAVNLVTALMFFSVIENRKRVYGLKEAAAGMGMFLGAIVGGMLPALFAGAFGLDLDGPAPYRYGLVVATLVALAAIVPIVRLADVPRAPLAPRTTAARSSLASLKPLAALIFVALLNHAAVASARVFYPAYLDRIYGLPTALIGLIASIGTLLAVVGSLSGPRLMATRGSGFGMMIASIGLTGSLLLMGLFGNWVAAGAGTIGTLALIGIWTLAYQVLQMEMAAPEQRSMVAGVGWMGMSIGFTLMSFAGGQIVTAYGYRPVFLIGAVLAATSAAMMWRISRRAGMAPVTIGQDASGAVTGVSAAGIERQ